MRSVTLQQIHRDLTEIRQEIRSLRVLVEEDLEPADDVVREVAESRRRPREHLIPHRRIAEEFSRVT